MGLKKVLGFIIQHPISGKSKIRSIARFFWWQFRCLVTNEMYVHQFTLNSKLIIEKGMTGATGNLYCGLHEYKEMLFVLHFLRPEDLFVDVGANIGSFTVLASAEIGTKTYCFEPVPNTFKQLERNIALNKIQDKVSLFNIGLASSTGELYFSNNKNSTMNQVELSGSENNEFQLISVNTLNNLLTEALPILLKIDVEGFEFEVLKGASAILENSVLNAIIIELNGSGEKYGTKDQMIDELLKSYGFSSYVYNPFDRLLSPAKLNEFENLIYIRNENYVKMRLVTAPTFKILNLEI